jgi:ABC-type lipoprotein export system ATPase subunit
MSYWSDTAAIELMEVTRTFGSGERAVHAVRHVTLSVPRGAFVVLMGPSGSGKTTLLNMIGGLDQPTSGALSLDGQPLGRLGDADLAALRQQIGFIFQSFALTPTASAYENVELALRISRNTPRREWEARVRRSLAAVGLAEWMHHRPYEMSGGQQQRVAIARALAIRPRMILADEPTGDLDSATGARVLGLLRELCVRDGVTVVMATHDPAAAAFASDVYFMRDGEIIGHEPAVAQQAPQIAKA